MIGLVIVAHGRLADEFKAALEHIVGPQRQLATVSIAPDDDMVDRRQKILDAISETDIGKGTILLTDMFGGTPSNLAISVMDETNVEVLAGINLPVLVKLASIRMESSLKECVAESAEAGRKYIKVASQQLTSET
ncbi:MAG: PTS sugar transporter subunit IIA [Filomicrobium sp.]